MSATSENVLAIETAGVACGVAVLCADGRVASATMLRTRSQAEHLVPMAVRTISEAGLEFADIGAVAVSAGPGSYTGLRIGVSTAKGFASAHGARLVGVPTLQAYALSIAQACRRYGNAADIVAVALHARRSEVYFAAFEATAAEAAPVPVHDHCVLETVEAAEKIADLAGVRRVKIGGDAAKEVLLATRADVDVQEAVLDPGALSVGLIALQRLDEGHFDDLRSFEPFYLKDYVAKQGGSVFRRLNV